MSGLQNTSKNKRRKSDEVSRGSGWIELESAIILRGKVWNTFYFLDIWILDSFFLAGRDLIWGFCVLRSQACPIFCSRCWRWCSTKTIRVRDCITSSQVRSSHYATTALALVLASALLQGWRWRWRWRLVYRLFRAPLEIVASCLGVAVGCWRLKLTMSPWRDLFPLLVGFFAL